MCRSREAVINAGRRVTKPLSVLHEKRPSISHQHKPSHSAKTADEKEEGSRLFVMTGQATGQGIKNKWILDSGASRHTILDSGASRHTTSHKKLLRDYCKFDVPESVKVGDDRTVEAYGAGQAGITVEINRGKKLSTKTTGVLYVPKLACNLFSVRAVTQKCLVVQFGHSCC